MHVMNLDQSFSLQHFHLCFLEEMINFNYKTAKSITAGISLSMESKAFHNP